MKTIKFIFPLAMGILLSLQSCRKGNVWGIAGKGNNVTEYRTAGGFDRIELRTDADVLYTQDSTYFIEVTGQKNILDVLDTKIDGSTLTIDLRKNVWKHHKITVVVHSPHINSLSVNGSGDIEVQNNISTVNMSLNISGSGNISLPALNAQTFDGHISGSGNISVSGGNSSSASVSISGSGDIDILSMASVSATTKISGSGNIFVYVSENLNVTISGSGDVKYKGAPIVSSNISGSGHLTHI